MNKPLWLFSYDISNSKRLKRVYKLCCAEGWALQQSVFVIDLTKVEKVKFCKKLLNIIDQKQDKLLCIPFSTPDGSFHYGNKDKWLLIHTDHRLDGFVF